MMSIRRQLTRELLGFVLLLLGLGLAALYLAARDAATEQFDVALQAKARAISTLTILDDGRVRVAFNDHFMPGFEHRKPRDFFQVWDADGNEIARSESLTPGTQLPRRVGTLERPAAWNFDGPVGRPVRAVGFAFTVRPPHTHDRSRDREVRLVVATDREDLEETLWQLLGLCAGIAGLLAGATLWVIPRVLRRGLVPVNQLGQAATRIDADSLSTRFAAQEFPAELRPIAERLNDLLARLEDSFERERRFSADLAHELRTPLAELRSMTECALKWPESRDPDLDRDTLAIATQMERLVAHILALARGERGELAVELEPVPLHTLVTETWGTFSPRAAARGLTAELAVETCVVRVDRGLLRSVLNNLFENATDYAADGGTIRISLRQEAGTPVVVVANTVKDLAPADVPKLFDRFWRKESSRSGGLHLGLGLPLSRSFAEAMGWRLVARFEGDGTLAFTLTGPAGPAQEEAPANHAN